MITAIKKLPKYCSLLIQDLKIHLILISEEVDFDRYVFTDFEEDEIFSKHFVTALADEGTFEFGQVIVEVGLGCLCFNFKFTFPRFSEFTGSFPKEEVEGLLEVG